MTSSHVIAKTTLVHHNFIADLALVAAVLRKVLLLLVSS